MIRAAKVLAVLALVAGPARAECPFPGDQPVLVVQLFFGETMEQGRLVTAQEWRSFLQTVVTPAFPDGFTVFDGDGQWLDQHHHRLIREKTKIIEVAIANTEASKAVIGRVGASYKRRFHQQTVGVLSTPSCGNFSP